MRLFEAIIDANHRALRGDANAGLHVANYAAELPLVALTCVDPRLNPLFPGAMALPPESFIWLRNAGNIITGPLSSTMRSLALACAIKGGREIAIIGHTDCQVRRTTTSELTERFKALGVDRTQLPLNLTEFFGTFASEQQNVIRAVEIVRQSPLIGPRVPVQGLMIDVATGRLEWVVNGYDTLDRQAAQVVPTPQIGGTIGNLADRIGSAIGEIKFPDTKIGELATEVKQLMTAPKPAPSPSPPAAPSQRPIPVPPPIRMHPRDGRR
jgi:carbonic anhydrase